MSLGRFLIRKTAIAIATMVAVSFLIFLALEVNIEEVAVKVLGSIPPPNSVRPGCCKTAITNRS